MKGPNETKSDHTLTHAQGMVLQGLIRGGVNAHLANPGYGAAGPH